MASKSERTDNHPLRRILIANRGEIAVRIIRSIRELSLESIAVYSDADANSMHRRLADHAVRLPGISSTETYLNSSALMEAAAVSGAEAIHPGYGFLSESHVFAETVTAAGLKFIGPSPSAMKIMGHKVHARQLMIEHEVPVVPGSQAPLASLEELEALATKIGFPVILKAAAGGGGRGMRVAREPSELADSFAACKREAESYFGNPEVFCEKYIENPRHIEFQVLFDGHGHGVHLFERDCSIQRRHQKLIEEAPSSFLNDHQRAWLGAKALNAAKAVGYEGAGTVEFICNGPDEAYFMEMNTRIQVEHPVTEMITGKDLIAWQLRIACGEQLGFSQEDLSINGWSIEARINAENPLENFAPTAGLVRRVELPQGPFVRVDTHLYDGYQIPSAYDSMVAKVIVWGEDRAVACARLKRALSELRIDGVPTTTRFHEALLAHPAFRDGTFTTRFLEENADYFKEAMTGDETDESSERIAALLAAVLSVERERRRDACLTSSRPLWQSRSRLETLE